MTNSYAQFKEIYDELNNLRSCTEELVSVSTNINDRLRRLEEARKKNDKLLDLLDRLNVLIKNSC